jgi:hypothetical protein
MNDTAATGEVLEAVVSALVKKETLPLVQTVAQLKIEVAELRAALRRCGGGDV